MGLLLGGCGSYSPGEPRVCPEGRDGCPCDQGTCAGDLVCLNNQCLDPTRGLTPRVDFFRVLPTTVTPPGRMAVSWSASSSEECEARGSLPGWVGEEVGVQGNMEIEVGEEVLPGDYRVELFCSLGRKGDQKSVQVRVLGEGVTGPRIEFFEVNGRASAIGVEEGDGLNVAWEARDALVCAAGGDFPGWYGSRGEEGEENFSTEGLEVGPYTLTLQCTDGAVDTETLSRVVHVQSGDADCSARLPPSGWSAGFELRDENGDGQGERFEGIAEWEEIYGAPFPAGRNQRHRMVTGEREYGAIGFDVPEDFAGVVQIAHEEWSEAGEEVGSGPKVWTVSRCPGDFGAQEHLRCVQQGASTGGIRWGSEESGAFTVFHCPVEGGKRYYWNVLWGSADENGEATWECQDRLACGDQLATWITLD